MVPLTSVAKPLVRSSSRGGRSGAWCNADRLVMTHRHRLLNRRLVLRMALNNLCRLVRWKQPMRLQNMLN